jgi:hypothetical protein
MIRLLIADQSRALKAPKRDGCHGSTLPVLAISTSLKRGTAMKKIAVILALAFAFTAGMALTTAFAFGLLPLLLT